MDERIRPAREFIDSATTREERYIRKTLVFAMLYGAMVLPV